MRCLMTRGVRLTHVAPFQQRIQTMNAGHKLGRKRNRLSRCRKRLASGECVAAQRLALESRASQLEAELNKAK